MKVRRFGNPLSPIVGIVIFTRPIEGTSNELYCPAVIRLPPGLEADIVEIDGDRMVVFAWPAITKHDSQVALTAAERQVVDHVMRGASNAEIASSRGTSARTVANQVQSILRKVRVRSRHELIAKISAW